MKRSFILFGVLALVLISAFAVYGGPPPQPTYGSANVDGDDGEWNLTTDFFAEMRRAGDTEKVVASNLYLRYDCGTETMYALVLTVSKDVPALVEPEEAWIAIDGNKKVSFSAFEWVDKGYDGNSDHARGWEASFSIAEGSYKILAHVNVFDDGESQTSATEKDGIPLKIECGSTPVTLSSFTATADDGVVILNWTTGSETENLGYHVYRSLREDGEYQKITPALIEGGGSSRTTRTYQFVDRDVQPGARYFYKLEQLDFDGATEMHGPIVGKATAMQATTWGQTKSLLK